MEVEEWGSREWGGGVQRDLTTGRFHGRWRAEDGAWEDVDAVPECHSLEKVLHSWECSPSVPSRLVASMSQMQTRALNLSSVQFSRSVVSNSATPWTAARQASLSINNSKELTQKHVHWDGDTMQPSHPLSPPSPPAFNLSQHQGLYQWVSSSHQVATVLEFQLDHQSFQWIFRTDFL